MPKGPSSTHRTPTATSTAAENLRAADLTQPMDVPAATDGDGAPALSSDAQADPTHATVSAFEPPAGHPVPAPSAGASRSSQPGGRAGSGRPTSLDRAAATDGEVATAVRSLAHLAELDRFAGRYQADVDHLRALARFAAEASDRLADHDLVPTDLLARGLADLQAWAADRGVDGA